MRWLNPALVAFALVPGLTGLALAQQPVPVDRWLVSSAFPAGDDADPLGEDYLSAPGEIGVLPDRGRTVAGADWALIRRDSASVLDLEEQRAGIDGTAVVYAHAYLRSAADRTIVLTWGGLGCTRVTAWLNGRSLSRLGQPVTNRAAGTEDERLRALVRVGRGYNTLLVKAVSGDCPFGVAASFAPASSESLDGLRAQASRPHGITRTGPSPWLVVDPDAGPEAMLGWKGDQLFGAAGVRVAAFAVTAVEGARLKAKTGGEEVKRDLDWLTPAEPRTVLMPFAFKSLHQSVTRGEGLDIELDWGDGKSSGALELDPSALLVAFHSPIRLLGWMTPNAGEAPSQAVAGIYDSDDEPHPLAQLLPLPEGAGTTLLGEWEVPGWLSGFTLQLDVSGSPGDYRLGSIPVREDRITLCADCRKGQRIALTVVTTDAWERFPGASVAGVSEPEVDGAVQAAEWLRLLDEKGSRKYRERAGSTGP